jgi:uncharacterized protein (TIGR01777 family)
MHILITGGTGALGRRLVDHLIQYGHLVTVVSRQEYKPATLPAKINFAQWDAKTAAGWGHLVEEADAIVNFAGAGLAEARWTEERKKVLRDSRVHAGQAVVEAISAASHRPHVLVQASAVGYYGPRKEEIIQEDSSSGNDFLAEICKAWEASSQPVEEMGVRRVVIRSGLVLDTRGGALPKMLLPFHFFVGGPVGSGKQWYPWIHYFDELNAIRFLIDNEAARGPFNLCTPNPLRNRDFARAIGKAMKRPALVPAPGIMIKLLYGEMSTVVLDGQQAVPRALQELGYEFKFPTAEAALVNLLSRDRR